MPLQHRHGYAAGIHHGLPTGDITQPRSSLPDGAIIDAAEQVRAATHPRSVRFEVVALLRGFQPVVPHVRLSVSLAGPRPSDGAGPFRRCQDCFHPHPLSRGSGCPQLSTTCCDRPPAVSFHHRKVQQRLVALNVGHPEPVRCGGCDRRWARSAGRLAVGPGIVVRLTFRRRAPTGPLSRISRATVHRATGVPSRLSWSQILRAPVHLVVPSVHRATLSLRVSSRTSRRVGVLSRCS